jgi:hypothetical protein
LRDRTLDEVVYFAKATNTTERIGLEKVEFYSSAEGIRLFKGHEYELVSVYNNTSEKTVDSMAVMYLYMKDQRYAKPSVEAWTSMDLGATPPQAPGTM